MSSIMKVEIPFSIEALLTEAMVPEKKFSSFAAFLEWISLDENSIDELSVDQLNNFESKYNYNQTQRFTLGLFANKIVDASKKWSKSKSTSYNAVQETFALNGLPPLTRSTHGSSSDSSVNSGHKAAIFVEKNFSVVEDIVMKGGTVLWTKFREQGHLGIDNSESGIQGLVRLALEDAIVALGLSAELRCYNELSLFRLRADIWIVVASGVPIGVVEVKKRPSKIDLFNHPQVHGQILDYMLRLKSFHGLRHVFGIVTTYEQWRFYWLPDCDEVANATRSTTQLPVPEQDAIEVPEDTDDASQVDVIDATPVSTNSRIVHGSPIISWNNANFSKLLGSLLLKMKDSPIDTVNTFDTKRSYIVMDTEKWYWATIKLPVGFRFKTGVLPNSKTMILLQDFRGGADGRVWLACSPAGVTCVIKFAQKLGIFDEKSDFRRRLEEENNNWHKIWNHTAEVRKLAGDYALFMPYLRPVVRNEETEIEVKKAIQYMANLHLCHTDLKWEHVGFVSPAKKHKKKGRVGICFSDLKRIEEMDTEEAKNKMYEQLGLSD